MVFITGLVEPLCLLKVLDKYGKMTNLRDGGVKWGVLVDCGELTKQEGMDN